MKITYDKFPDDPDESFVRTFNLIDFDGLADDLAELEAALERDERDALQARREEFYADLSPEDAEIARAIDEADDALQEDDNHGDS